MSGFFIFIEFIVLVKRLLNYLFRVLFPKLSMLIVKIEVGNFPEPLKIHYNIHLNKENRGVGLTSADKII